MSQLTKSAKGRECQARIPQICNRDLDTVVLAHINGAGMGRKHPDLFACFACSDCHRWLDGEYVNYNPVNILVDSDINSKNTRDLYHLQAVMRTQQIWLKEGLITIEC